MSEGAGAADFVTMTFAAFNRKAAAKKAGRPAPQAWAEKKKDKKLVLLKVIVFVLLILVAAEGVLYTVIIPALAPVKIQFTGARNLTVQELTQKVGELKAATWIQFDAARAVEVLGSISCVEKVTVDKHFPDKVFVQIEEREAVARTIVPVNGRLVSVQIDRNGVLFTQGGGAPDHAPLPLVSGLPVEDMRDGMRVPARFRPLMEQIAEISRVNRRYFDAISEIQVIPKEYGNYELMLYPVYTRVRVLTDRALNEDALKYMMVALDVVNSIEPDAGEIDLRYGAVSYRKR